MNTKRNSILFYFEGLILLLCGVYLFFGIGSIGVQAGADTVFKLSRPANLPRIPMWLDSLPPVSLAAQHSIRPQLFSEEATGVGLRAHDGTAFSLNSENGVHGLFVRKDVKLTPKLRHFAAELSQYLMEKEFFAEISSGVRNAPGQLSIIKERIASLGASGKYPELAKASIRDTASWIPALKYLHQKGVPVNAPMSVKGDTDMLNGSLHITGLALDLVAEDLDGLASAIDSFFLTYAPAKNSLKTLSYLREPDCVHISLAH